ncbi:peptidoglycan-associated lipoprotein Pal [Nitrospina gracilis]|uniref:peptidoglycan-associated lipoprotein Pal n=1 Tax=Nitrospina gracilis TaxID=35801 RepID=UPI001F010248|nr:peptidoglycan-associated lipoprotein Pal [Nitrospina gracilis]
MNTLLKAKEMRLICGIAIFILAVGITGCAKKLAPEVENPPEEPVETVSVEPEPTPEPETQLEEGFGIQVQDTEESGAFITESPEQPVEETVESTTIPDFQVETPKEEATTQVEQMDMTNEPFVATPQENPVIEDTAKVFEQPEEPEKIEEARLLAFEPTAQVEDVYFAFDSFDLDEKSKDRLRANVEWLKQNPNAKVEIQGHCDERGTNNYNLGLGERRALATKKFLAAQGVDESRLHTISYGEEKPFCFESSENCWWRNRRAHFLISE